jgi:hypothetical protein
VVCRKVVVRPFDVPMKLVGQVAGVVVRHNLVVSEEVH